MLVQTQRELIVLGKSLVAQPAAMWPGSSTSADARAMGIIPSLLRLSIGIERGEDLIADLEQSLRG